jgi:hypothetical protein
MDVLFSILAILIFALFLQKPISKLIKKDEDVPYIEIEDHIDNLTALKNHLNDIEQMITDVQICTPSERATAFKLYMHTNNTAVDILADSASENVLALLFAERQKLRSSLYHEIKNLYDRCNSNSNGNNMNLYEN